MDLISMSVLLAQAQGAGECNAKCGLIIGGAALAGLVIGFLIGRACGKGKCGAKAAGGAPAQATKGMVEIYVGNLSYDWTEDAMRKEFEKYGKVFSARIITNRFNNKSKGFGFVEMPSRAEADAAVKALNDKEILGRKLRVNVAKNKVHE